MNDLEQLRRRISELEESEIMWKKAEQKLNSLNKQLIADEQQLKAANQQLVASEQQLKAANQQLTASDQQLRAANQQLEASEQQLKAYNQQLAASEKQLKQTVFNLEKRVKELSGLFAISEIVEIPDISLNEILQDTAESIINAWQYPEITCVKITFNNREFKSKNYSDSEWKQSCDLIVNREQAGQVEVSYLEQKPEVYEGPFLKEERNLLSNISERLGRIIERKLAEESLRQYESIVSSSTDMLALLDKKFTYLAVNNAYANAFNLTREELIGKSVAEVFGEEFFKNVIKPHADRCLKGEEANYQDWFDFPSYGKRYMDITYYPYTDQKKKILGIVVNARNNTERKRAEEVLQLHEKQLSLIYDSVADIIFYLKVEPGPHYKFLSVNKTFLKATGLSAEQIVGKAINEVIPESSHQVVFSNYEKAIRDKMIVSWEETSQYPAGLKTGIVSIAPIFDDKGTCTHLIGSVHDITERKQSEEELKKRNRELETFNDVTIGREFKIIELKKEINELLEKSGEKPKYEIVD